MNANVPDTLIFRRMQLGDTESVLDLAKSGLTYVDLVAADHDPHDYTSMYIMSGLAYGDLDPTDPDSPLAMSFVAEIGKKVIGFLLAYAHFIGIPITRICVIHAIVVDPDYHGQGIGTQLLRQLQSKCKEEDIKIMRILVRQHNTQLRNYIGSLGFHQSKVMIFDKLS
jgi:ribosomal protein S18 acetylase RimI-like enzyme